MCTQGKYELLSLAFGGGKEIQAWVEVIIIRPNGEIVTERLESGFGVIGVTFRVLDKAVGAPELTSNNPFVECYEIETSGRYGARADLQVEVRLRSGPSRSIGVGKDDCVVMASALAYINAINKIV